MPHKIIWSPEAVADLTEIRAYIARDSDGYAAAMMERILVAVDRLANYPKLGQRVPELDDESLRQVIVVPYRVIYRLGAQSVDVAAVVHGARDLRKAVVERDL
jgi:toxin ParE1/3/4